MARRSRTSPTSNAWSASFAHTHRTGRVRAWFGPGHYAVTFFITGSNFDAVTYVGHFDVGRSERESDGRSIVRVSFRWVERPSRRSGTAGRELRLKPRCHPPDIGDDWSRPPMSDSEPSDGRA